MDLYRALGWMVPAVCFAGSGYLIFSKNNELGKAQLERDAATQDRVSAVRDKNEAQQEPPTVYYAAEVQTLGEQPQFISDLTRREKETGAKVANLIFASQTYGPGQAVPPDPADVGALTGITRSSCNMTVEGPYPTVRKFVASLTTSNRLFTLSNIQWSRADSGTTLNLSLNRYLTPAPPAK